jgi:uncharacterized membrane protein YtjA (UPF0391 family)
MNSLANVFDLFTNEFTCLRARRFPFRFVVPGTLECPLFGHGGLLSKLHICDEGKSHRPCQFLRPRGKSLPSLPHRRPSSRRRCLPYSVKSTDSGKIGCGTHGHREGLVAQSAEIRANLACNDDLAWQLPLEVGRRTKDMLYYALIFLLVGLVAGALGLFGVAAIAGQISWILFLVGVVILIVHLVAGRDTRAL